MTLLVPLVGAMGILLLYAGLTGPPNAERRPGLAARFGVTRASLRVLVAGVTTGIAGFVVVAGMTKVAAVALAAAIGSGAIVVSWVRGGEGRRRVNLQDEWPDVLALLISAVRAGISLPEACADLAARAGPATRPALEAYVATYRATGSFLAGLESLRAEAADPIGDRIVLSLQAAHELGGSDLVPVLQTLAEFVQQDLRVRKEIEARWSWNVTAARVAAAAPPIVLLLMTTRPEGSAAFGTGAGSAVVLTVAVATALGYRLMLRIARLPRNERLP